MSDTTTTRKLNIWINGKEVENNFKSITAAMAQAKNQLAKMEIGTQEYYNQVKKIQQLKGHIDNHIRNLKGVQTAWQQVKSNVMQIAGGNLFANVFQQGLSMIGSVISDAWNRIKEFSTGVSQLKAITGLSGDALIDLKNNAKDMAAEFGTSSRKVVDAMKWVGSAKPELLKSVSGLTEVTKAVMVLSKTSDVLSNVELATKSLTTIMNQFGHAGNKANEDINILAAGAKYGSVEVDYLAESLSKTGTVMKSAGMNLQQGTAVMELFGEKGVQAETAGRGFKSILVDLQKDSKNYTNGVFDLNKAIDNNQKISGNNILLQEKFGKEFFSLAQILFQNKERFNELTTQVSGTNVAFEQYAEATNNLSGDLDKASGAYDKFILSMEDGEGILGKTVRFIVQLVTKLTNLQSALNGLGSNKGGVNFAKNYLGLQEKINQQLLIQRLTIEKLTDQNVKDNYIRERIIKLTTQQRMAEIHLSEETKKKTSIGGEKRKAQLNMEIEVYKQLVDQLNSYKEAQKEVGDVEPISSTLTKAELDKLEKEKLKKLEDYKKAYEDLRKQILQMRQKYNLEDLSEEDKAIAEIENKYQEQLDVVDNFITELETKQATKQGLNSDELDLLSKFYSQKSNLISLREYEIEAVNKDFDAKKLEEKKKIEQQIFDITASASEKERAEILKKYQDLIKAAELYGIDTVELYKKMNAELAVFALGNAVSSIKDQGEKKDIFGMTQTDWDNFNKNFEKAMQFADAAKGMVSAFFDFQSNKEAAALQQYEENTAKKKEALQKQLDSGRISQENYNKQVSDLDNKLNIEKKKAAIADAKRSKNMRRFDAIMNTAAAIIGFLANPGGIFGLGLSIMAGITGGMQIAAINKEPLPKMAKGARVNKPTTALIGEAGPEIVLSNGIVSDPTLGPIADDLARIQEGKKPNFLGKPNMPNYSGMNNAIGGSSSNVVTTNNTTINQVDNKSIDSMKSEISEMKKHIVKMTDSVTKLKYLKAVISQDDQKDFDDDEKIRLRYSGI